MSVDLPFGYKLQAQPDFSQWDWSQLYTPGAFKWKLGVTPFSNLEVIILSWAVYYSGLLLCHFLLKKPQRLGYFPAIHNFLLSAWSFAMFAVGAYDTVERASRLGVAEIFCAEDPASTTTGRLFFVTYWYYLSKFYELLDTAILALKKKDLTFLHVFHHSIVILMVWTWLEDPNLYATLGLLFNSGIHTIMYIYFGCSALGISIWFKKYITSMQIVQFCTSFILSIPYLYFHFTRTCPTGFTAFGFSMVCNGIFLILFIQFYGKTYAPAIIKKKKNE